MPFFFTTRMVQSGYVFNKFHLHLDIDHKRDYIQQQNKNKMFRQRHVQYKILQARIKYWTE